MPQHSGLVHTVLRTNTCRMLRCKDNPLDCLLDESMTRHVAIAGGFPVPTGSDQNSIAGGDKHPVVNALTAVKVR
jgi:hypothetical protein